MKRKETLYGISKGYRVEIEDIKKINPGLDENLKEGQMLKIPVLKKPGIGLSLLNAGKTVMGIPFLKGTMTSHIWQSHTGCQYQDRDPVNNIGA